MKILFVATVRSHIGQFHMPFIDELKRRGCKVYGAYRDNSAEKQGLDLSALDGVYEIPFSRSPYSTSNIKAYFKLKKIIDENDFDAIHCHTPMGAVVTRLAAKKARKRGVKVIYTAHGFHFYKGAPKKNILLYYPVEKYLSKYTDCLITINQEDYDAATQKGFKAGEIYKVNGVGVDISRFHPVSYEEKLKLREEYGYDKGDFIMIYPADFCKRKNQTMLFEALKKIKEQGYAMKLLLPGSLEFADEYIEQAKNMGVYDDISFMGYRRDIQNLVALSDISVSSTRQEGLPINLVEAMAVGNPIVATDVRGNNDLVHNGVNGYLVNLGDSDAMAQRLIEFYNDRERIAEFGKNSIDIARTYSVESVILKMVEIYKELDLI